METTKLQVVKVTELEYATVLTLQTEAAMIGDIAILGKSYRLRAQKGIKVAEGQVMEITNNMFRIETKTFKRTDGTEFTTEWLERVIDIKRV
jgi:hypothetical protein